MQRNFQTTERETLKLWNEWSFVYSSHEIGAYLQIYHKYWFVNNEKLFKSTNILYIYEFNISHWWKTIRIILSVTDMYRITLIFSATDAIVPNLLCMPLCPRPGLTVEIRGINGRGHTKCSSNTKKDELQCREYYIIKSCSWKKHVAHSFVWVIYLWIYCLIG